VEFLPLNERKEDCHMDTASMTIAGNRFRDPIILEADEIYEACFHHPAVGALQAFDRHFDSRPLTRTELRLFLASMASFNRHTIGGIAILAGRLSDEILPVVPKRGHEVGAYVLDAAVDEYGLRESVTHVELARDFAEYLGVSSEEVEAPTNACTAAIKLGDALFPWYRKNPVAFALGVHTASEVTSVQEFVPWHDTFLKFPEYRFSRTTPQFEYMRAHAVHEPDHINGAKLCIRRYLDVFPDRGSLLHEGAQAYLSLYEIMLRQLDAQIFGQFNQ
jgi:hypothetical protein